MAKFSETSNAKKGGLFVGDSHAEGGIPAIVTDTGQPIEVEGGEAIINKKATALHWEELSKINQSAGGGVPIPPPDDADKVLEKYSQGGKITNKEKKVVFDKWKKLVNMTFTELSRYYHSKEGKESGLSEAEAKEQGISSGRESAEWILKMKKTNWKKWTDDMWKWANKQISFISRMSGLQGDLTDDKGKKTRKYKALMIWGNNPKKKNAVSFKTGNLISSSRWKPEHIKQLKPINLNTNDVHYKTGGDIPETSNTYAFVTSTSTTGKRLFKVFDHIPTNKEVYDYYQQVNKKIGTPIEIVDSSISIEVLSGFDRENFLKLLNEVALIQFSSKIKDIKDLMFSFDPKTFNVYEFEAELNYGRIVKVKMVDGVIFLEDKYEKGGELLKRKDGSYSKRGLWDNVRANIGSGKEPTPEMLKQEEYIKQKYHLGGNMSKHLAPNGNSSNLTHEQWHLVRTPEFKAWFGDWENSPETASKVVDENGEPLVVYHFSDVDFNVFEIKGVSKGFFFTENRYDDEFSAEGVLKALENGEKLEWVEDLMKRGLPIEVLKKGLYESKYEKSRLFFLNIKKMFPFEDIGKVAKKDWSNPFYENPYIQKAKIRNYDGIEFLKEITNKRIIVAFEPNQIKLADGTNTTFDGNNPDIRFETGGAVQKSSPDTYENKLLQIRVIGGENSYYKRINQEWKFLSSKELELLKEGTKHELEHIETIEAFKRKDIPSNIVASFIAFDHINETPDYYKKLEQAIPEKMEKGNKIEQPKLFVIEYELNGKINKSEYLVFPEDRIEKFFPPSATIISITEKMEKGGKLESYLSTRSEMFDDSSKTLSKAEVEKFAKLSKDSPNKFWVKDITTGFSYYIFKGELRANDSTEGIHKTSLRSFSDLKDSHKFKIQEKELYQWEKDSDPDRKRTGWDLISQKFGEIYYTNSDETDEELVGSEVKAEKRLWQFDRYSPYPMRLSWSEAEDMFKKSLTKDELNNIEISYTTEEYADIEEHDVEREYRNIIVKKKALKEEPIKETPIEQDKIIDSKNKDKKYAFELKPTDVILDPVSNTKKTIERTDVFDKYVNLWFTDSTMTRINNTGPHLSKFEVFSSSETTIKNPIKKETPMEQQPEPEPANPTGLVTNNWNEVPVRWKNVKAIRPVTFSINPFDKGLQSIVKVFTGDDDLRPIMSAIRFEEKGLVVTDAHKLLHIAYKHSDFIGNYPSLNSQKAYGKYTSPEDIQKQLNEAKFPNWEAVIPKDSEYVYEFDTLKLYQYCKVAANYANKTTNQVAFKYDNKSIGFNVKFLIDSLEAMMKIQKAPKLYIHLTEPSRAAILSFDKSISVVSSTYTLLMPVMLWRGASAKYDAITQIYGASDIDLNKSLGCYFDFTDNNIHNANGTIADYKESYGDSGGLPLDIITMMDRFIKIGKTRLPILENVLVDGNGIRVMSLNSRIEIANDWDIPNGIYSISNNALVKSGMYANIEDFPRIFQRVPTSNETFSINADIFKFYIEKAANHISNDDLRPVMNGICFESINSQLSIVSTDSHTLFHADLSKYAINFRHNFSFIIPDIKQILNFCKNIESEEVKFYVDDFNPVNFRIGAGRIHFEGKLEDGKYPNWRAIVPQTFSNQLIFDLKDMYNCLNNEMAKSFSKEVDNNAKNLTIFNQSNKIFISETQDRKKPDEAKTKEICEIKITKKELSEPSEFNIGSNFVLLMPVMNTNGTYFNFNVGKFNNVISTIGKEKVIIDYNTLSSVYIFTSDNLDYKTSDAYKPTKVDKPKIDKPIKNIISKEPKTYPAAIKTMDKPIAKFTPEAVTLIPKNQLKVVKNVGNKEFEQTIIDINNIVARIPKLYGQDGIKDKMVYLHYFYGDQDWFVTELDKSTGECFGYADLGYGAELGYMSIPEFVSNGKVELDFYFEPKKWSAIAKPDDSAFEKQNKAVKPLAKKPKSIPKTIKPDFETQTFSAKDDLGRPFLFIVGETPTDKQGAIKYLNNGYWIDNQKGFNGLITSYFKDIDTMKNNISAKYYNQIFNEETLSKSKPLKEKVLGIEYKVGTKGHAKAVAQKKQFDDLNKSESGTSDITELKDAVRGLEAFMKTISDTTEKAQLKQAINGLKALLK